MYTFPYFPHSLSTSFNLTESRDLDLEPPLRTDLNYDRIPIWKRDFSQAHLQGFWKTHSGLTAETGLYQENEIKLLNDVILYQKDSVRTRGIMKANITCVPSPASPFRNPVTFTCDVDNLRTFSPIPSFPETYIDAATNIEHRTPSLMILRNVGFLSLWKDGRDMSGDRDWVRGMWDVALLWWGDRYEKRWIVCSMNRVLDRFYSYRATETGLPLQPTNECPPPVGDRLKRPASSHPYNQSYDRGIRGSSAIRGRGRGRGQGRGSSGHGGDGLIIKGVALGDEGRGPRDCFR